MKEIRVEYDMTPLDTVEIAEQILKDLGVSFTVTLNESETGYIIRYEVPSNSR